MAKRISKAEARRRAADIAKTQELTEPQILDTNLNYLREFTAASTPPQLREVVRTAVQEICGRATHIKGPASFKKRISDVSALAEWAASTGRSTQWRDLMDHAAIHDFQRAKDGTANPESLIRRIGRLKSLASAINPGHTAPPKTPAGSRTRVKPPYTAEEDRALQRMIRGQSDQSLRRQVMLLYGLSRGAGATSADLRRFTAANATDYGDHGIDVALGDGHTARVVPVMKSYEAFVREGLMDTATDGPVFGQGGKNVINDLIKRTTVLSTDVPDIEVTRLRTTWLSEIMQRPIPLSALMNAAGLRGARTFADIWDAMRIAGQLPAVDVEAAR